jgi:hypothetical protein
MSFPHRQSIPWLLLLQPSRQDGDSRRDRGGDVALLSSSRAESIFLWKSGLLGIDSATGHDGVLFWWLWIVEEDNRLTGVEEAQCTQSIQSADFVFVATRSLPMGSGWY